MIFRDRTQAGRLLAERLVNEATDETIVLALPRGGVPVAAEISQELDVPLDVLIVRKIGAPFHSELAVGALCEDAEPVWNKTILYQLGLAPEDLDEAVRSERSKIKKQIEFFRRSQNLPPVRGKRVILVDDGLATGATMRAAIEYLKDLEAGRIIVAVPVAAQSSASQLRPQVDELFVLQERDDLMSIGQWYADFSQVTDDEVMLLLDQQSRQFEPLTNEVEMDLHHVQLKGDLTTFPSMKALVIFAHGSGSSRKSPRNQKVARYLNEKGLGTLLFDLLTNEEARNRGNVFNIEFLSERLTAVTRWLRRRQGFQNQPIGFFGASTGAGAAVKAASHLKDNENIFAIVSRGGRPDLAGEALRLVKVPTLLLVGGEDFGVIELNQKAQRQLAQSRISIVPGASHLFEEPGALEEVSRQAADWFLEHLPMAEFKTRERYGSETVERTDFRP